MEMNAEPFLSLCPSAVRISSIIQNVGYGGEMVPFQEGLSKLDEEKLEIKFRVVGGLKDLNRAFQFRLNFRRKTF